MIDCSPENIKELYYKIYPLTANKKRKYAQLWDKWSLSDAVLRIIDEDYNIVELAEDYSDNMILSRCSNEYQPVVSIVAHVLSDINFQAGDIYLSKRMRELVKQGKLKAIQRDMSQFKNIPPYKKIIVDGVDISYSTFYDVKLK